MTGKLQTQQNSRKAVEKGVSFDQKYEIITSMNIMRLFSAVADIIKDKDAIKFVYRSLQNITNETQDGKK